MSYRYTSVVRQWVFVKIYQKFNTNMLIIKSLSKKSKLNKHKAKQVKKNHYLLQLHRCEKKPYLQHRWVKNPIFTQIRTLDWSQPMQARAKQKHKTIKSKNTLTMVSGFLHALSSALAFLCTSHQIFLDMAAAMSKKDDSTSDLHPFQYSRTRLRRIRNCYHQEPRTFSYFTTSIQSFQWCPWGKSESSYP